MTGIVILGAGGHARVILSALKAGKSPPVVGCIAPESPASGWPQDIAYLGPDSALRALDPGKTRLVNGIGGTRSNEKRRSAFEQAKAAGFSFQTVVHPSALLDEGVIVAEGAVIMMGAILQRGCTVGQNAIVNTGAIVDHDCRIGAHVHVATGARLSGSVQVGDGAHIGTGASVIQGIQIGRNAMLAAGCVAVQDVLDGVSVAGIPARPM